jgi:hypothetical protein
MPLLEQNISQNKNSGCFSTAAAARPRALVLNWDDESLPVEVLELYSEGRVDAIL